jgi:hypothetical protein
MVGTLAMTQVTTTITVTVNYIQEPHKALDLYRSKAMPWTSLTLIAHNRRRP